MDYSLLMTSRFREELAARGGGPEAVHDAVGATMATAGRAVFFSGLTVLLGLLGLILFEFMILRSVGIAGAIVVGFAVLSALTLLPALLAIAGHRIDAFRVRPIGRSTGVDGPWARLANRVMDRPFRVLIPTLGLLLVLGVPFLHVRFNAPDASILPATVPSRDRLRSTHGGLRAGPIRADRARRPNRRACHRSGQPRPRPRLHAGPRRRPADRAQSRASWMSTRG